MEIFGKYVFGNYYVSILWPDSKGKCDHVVFRVKKWLRQRRDVEWERQKWLRPKRDQFCPISKARCVRQKRLRADVVIAALAFLCHPPGKNDYVWT